MVLLAEPVDCWDAVKALSCLSSSEGKHGKHYLNERRKMLAFWAQFIIDNGEQDDVRLDVMPCFDHKRFLIRGEVSFYAAARMRMIMTYISELRIEDPNVETNLLIKKTWLLNGVIEQSQMLAWAVQFGSVDCLMRYLIQKDGFVALHEKRDIMQIQMEATHKLGECTTESFEFLYRKVLEYLDPPRQAKLERYWNSLHESRLIVFRRAQSREFCHYVSQYLYAGADEAVRALKKHEDAPSKGITCLEKSVIHNMHNEAAFGRYSEAARGKNAGVSRNRGRVLDMSHGHTSTELQNHDRRRERFLSLKKKGDLTDDDWISWEKKERRYPSPSNPNHNNTTTNTTPANPRLQSIKSLFNDKCMPLAERHELIRRELSQVRNKSTELRDQKQAQVDRGLELLEQQNVSKRRSYETKIDEFQKFAQVERLATIDQMDIYLAREDPGDPGKEYSYAQKVKIVQQQIQLRKKYFLNSSPPPTIHPLK